MKQLLYLEIPTPDTAAVRTWLQDKWQLDVSPISIEKSPTPDGVRLAFQAGEAETPPAELSIFLWSVQRTTYLKAFRWSDRPLPSEARAIATLERDIRIQFPNHYPEPPEIDLTNCSIFDALQPHYPQTV